MNQLSHKLIDFGLSEIADYDSFQVLTQKTLSKFKDYVKKQKLQVNINLINEDFNFYDFLKKSYLIISNESLVQDHQVSITKINSDLFHHIMDETSHNSEFYTSNVNKLHSKFSTKSNSTVRKIIPIPSTQQLSFEIFPVDSEPRTPFLSQLKLFIFDEPPEIKLLKLPKDKKRKFDKIFKKLKSKAIRGTIKYASIFSLLKIKSHFLGDVESMFYSILNILGLFPQHAPMPRCSNNSSYTRNRIFKSELDINTKNKDRLILPGDKLLSQDQVDLLLTVLTLIQKKDYPHHESAILRMFQFGMRASLHFNRRKMHETVKEFRCNNLRYDQFNEVSRFKRMKFIIKEIFAKRSNLVHEVLNLNSEVVQSLQVKLGMRFTPEFDLLPLHLQRFYSKFQQFFFNYSLMVMFSREILFVHKFCIILILQSQYGALG